MTLTHLSITNNYAWFTEQVQQGIYVIKYIWFRSKYCQVWTKTGCASYLASWRQIKSSDPHKIRLLSTKTPTNSVINLNINTSFHICEKKNYFHSLVIVVQSAAWKSLFPVFLKVYPLLPRLPALYRHVPAPRPQVTHFRWTFSPILSSQHVKLSRNTFVCAGKADMSRGGVRKQVLWGDETSGWILNLFLGKGEGRGLCVVRMREPTTCWGYL